MNCGGAYIKLLVDTEDLDLVRMSVVCALEFTVPLFY